MKDICSKLLRNNYAAFFGIILFAGEKSLAHVRKRLQRHEWEGIMIRIVIADDDAIVREGLRMIIECQQDMELLDSAADGQQAVELCLKLKPDVALLDIRMPVMDGIDAASKIMSVEAAKPLLLTTFDEPELIIRAFRAGVNGYILKNSPADRILNAIRVIYAGGTVFQKDILDFIRGRISAGSPGRKLFEMMLSPRELEIARLIAEGLSNKNIGERLFLSGGTVRNHISTILEKTGLEHRTQIAVHYLTNT
jgi:DNA-binding NarL/FixJ family response regulator